MQLLLFGSLALFVVLHVVMYLCSTGRVRPNTRRTLFMGIHEWCI
jgi:hypothetical protein